MKKLSLLTLTLFLTACATPKPVFLQATGGSKSDATVDLSYSHTFLEIPQVDWEQGLSTAKERCSAWGYKSAEQFGGWRENCNSFDGYGNCLNKTITITYQCLD